MSLGETLSALLEEGLASDVFSAAQAWVDHAGQVVGRSVGASDDTLFDLASLTKPMATVSLVLHDLAAGRVRLDDLVPLSGARPFTLRQLLGHRSGLPAWHDFADEADRALGPGWLPGAPETVHLARRVIATMAERTEPDRGALYSDLGFMVLGWDLERRHGRSLRDLHPAYLSAPSHPDPGRFAPTRGCPRRPRRLFGEVHDTNTWLLGGAAGHAGLFATARQVGAWARALLDAHAGRPSRFEGALVRELWSPQARADGGSWVLGFDTPTPPNSSAGRQISPRAVGHLGFTGTSVWIDPDADLVIVLLTNRVDRSPDDQTAIRAFRPRFHDAIFDQIAG